MEIDDEDGLLRVESETLEELGDVGDPEGGLEAGANLLQALGEGQKSLRDAGGGPLESGGL